MEWAKGAQASAVRRKANPNILLTPEVRNINLKGIGKVTF